MVLSLYSIRPSSELLSCIVTLLLSLMAILSYQNLFIVPKEELTCFFILFFLIYFNESVQFVKTINIMKMYIQISSKICSQVQNIKFDRNFLFFWRKDILLYVHEHRSKSFSEANLLSTSHCKNLSRYTDVSTNLHLVQAI